jgi:adenosylcobinamide-GDP ribazoletransferase
LKSLFHSLVFAIQFLTVVPLIPRVEVDDGTAKKALIFFPLIGFMLGLFLLVLWKLLALSHRFNSLTIALLLVAGDIVITGAFHLDGLSDTSDAFLSTGKSREEKLSIMKDSHIGAMGATVLIIALLLKIFLIREVLDLTLPITLLIYPAIGRWSQVAAYYRSPYIREGGIGFIFSQQVDFKILALTSLWLIPCLLFPGFYLILLFNLLFLLCYLYYVQKKVGGITGDILGSLTILSEICFLLGVLLFR